MGPAHVMDTEPDALHFLERMVKGITFSGYSDFETNTYGVYCCYCQSVFDDTKEAEIVDAHPEYCDWRKASKYLEATK